MDTVNTLSGAIQTLWEKIAAFIPNLVTGILILIVGLIVASLLGRFAKKLIQFTKIDSLIKSSGAEKTLAKTGVSFSFAEIIGWIVKWFFILVTLVVAADTLNLPQITAFINVIILYIPNVIVAVVIVAIGLGVGHFLEGIIVRAATASGISNGYELLFGQVGKWSVVVFSVGAALVQLKVAPSLINILFAGIIGALALAFGLGGREKAAQAINQLDNIMKK